jgi:cell division septation protein DedD
LLKDIYTNYSGIIPLIRSASSPETPAVSKDMPVNQPVTIPADDGAPVTLPAREEEKTVTEIVPGPGNNTVEAEEEYTFTETPTASEPPKQEEVKPVVSPSPDSQYLIIAGAFKEQGNAESLVTKLREKGYKAELAGLSKSGLQMVSFGSFGTKEEALEALALIKKKENPGAWLLKK